MIDLLVGICVLIGTFFLFVGSFGIWRMPDLYCRMHAQTKSGTLGIIGILLGAALHLQDLSTTVIAVLTVIFQLLTSATGAHILSRAAHRSGVKHWEQTVQEDVK